MVLLVFWVVDVDMIDIRVFCRKLWILPPNHPWINRGFP